MIYFIQAGEDGPIKIGYTNGVEKRLQGLTTSSHKSLRVLFVMDGDVNKERDLHRLFDFARKKNEWFWPVKSLMAFIESCKLLSEVSKSLVTISTEKMELSKFFGLSISEKEELPSVEDAIKHTRRKRQVDELRVLELYRTGMSLRQICQDIYGNIGGKQLATLRIILNKNGEAER